MRVNRVVQVALVKALKNRVQPVCLPFMKALTICRSLSASSLITRGLLTAGMFFTGDFVRTQTSERGVPGET